MVDSRFAAPPEDIDDLRPVAANNSSKKGKGRQQEPKQAKRKAAILKNVEDDDTPDLYDEVLSGPLPSTSALGQAVEDEDGDLLENDDDAEQDEDVGEDGPLNLLPKVMQTDDVEEFRKKVDRTGLIYLSRIPPGMGPSKVKHILSNYGETGRIYLVAAEPEARNKNGTMKDLNKSHKHKPHRFVEGWIEFMDKKVARSTAELLNARSIGDVAISKNSKKNGGTKKWKDDVWTMKYLPRFKWNMLSEQVAVEAATRAAVLRNEIAQSKKEQAEYLRQVERAKNFDKAQDKKRARDERRAGPAASSAATDADADQHASKKAKKERVFEQREIVKSGGAMDAKLGSVLDSLF